MTSTPGSPAPLPVPAPVPLPLAERIRDIPFPLPLAEQLDMSIPPPELPSTPSPSEELHYPPCYGWLAVVFDVNGGGLILNVNNEYQRSTLISKGVQQSGESYNKGIVSGAVQAQSMTAVIEWKAVECTQEVDGGAY
jgi:hypothetical protein